ncbi:hypothetical protein GOBAR_AA30194 [Gossypium barbadense]|uniref:Uncharacterized protein n=1 Tax=Gossypium barbadense TaxID=3634 RepID=A0A2P5WHC0_GOSBA|nr:hypothetical protein GOBAR_AA30194 [Gossypium barbadense]
MLKYDEACQNELTETKIELERFREFHLKMREENEVINTQNGDLTEYLVVAEVKMEGLACEVAGSPFDAHAVDLDAFGEVDINQLDFDVLFPLGVVWNSFVSIWKNSPDFYLDKGPVEDNNATPLLVSDNKASYAENDIATTSSMRQDANRRKEETNVS